MPDILNNDRRLKVMRIEHARMIKDLTNSFLVQRSQTPLTIIPTNFERLQLWKSILIGQS